MIDFHGVSRSFGSRPAVIDLNLTIARGEIVALLGPNGAGKTTTLKMLVGLLRPQTGEIKVGGFDVSKNPREAHRLMAYVPDEPYLYEKLTGREFLGFITDLFHLPRDAAKARIARQIENFELADFVDRLTEQYSHGMKQRLAFAAALLREPGVLVLDEPMVGLDPRSIRTVKDLLRRQANEGTAILMSTHTLGMAEEIAQRIAIMHLGRMIFWGTLAELRERAAGRETTLESLFLELTNGVAA
jgi:ABC-2 type transport system ATP-binding protein